jgi:hypothetical protein
MTAGCNAVLGIDDAELLCGDVSCRDAASATTGGRVNAVAPGGRPPAATQSSSGSDPQGMDAGPLDGSVNPSGGVNGRESSALPLSGNGGSSGVGGSESGGGTGGSSGNSGGIGIGIGIDGIGSDNSGSGSDDDNGGSDDDNSGSDDDD